jgi:hypothetical protein
MDIMTITDATPMMMPSMVSRLAQRIGEQRFGGGRGCDRPYLHALAPIARALEVGMRGV